MKKLYKGMQDPTKVFLLIGTDEEAAEIQAELNVQGLTPKTHCILPEVLSDTLQDLENIAAVCCVSGALQKTDLQILCQFCQENKTLLFFCTPGLSVLQKNMRVKNVGFMSFLSPVEEPLSHWWNKLVKRLFDLLVSGIFLFFIFPFIYIVAAIIIKRKSPGPVFSIVKEKNGRGKPFDKLTFRTEDLPESSFLRKPALKNMPQLLNVFGGNMSVVPDMVNCRFCKNADVWYKQNWSLWIDIKILAKAILNKNKID